MSHYQIWASLILWTIFYAVIVEIFGIYKILLRDLLTIGFTSSS